MTRGMADRDQIRLVMHSQQLNNPISLPFMPVKELTPRRIMFEVERVLQSHEEFVLSNDLHINLIHLKMPSGSGRTKPYCGVNLKTRMLWKRYMVPVQNKDELCAARAIVTGIAKIEGFSNYRAKREARPIQRTKAWDLHHKAGVPLAPYQLVAVTGDHFNAIIYKGPETQKPIYLYHHDGHYDAITSMPAFLVRVYFCLKCEKGYNTEDRRHHSCENKCRCCHYIACPIKGRLVRGSHALGVTACSRVLDALRITTRGCKRWEIGVSNVYQMSKVR